MELNAIYFYTVSILDWVPLLKANDYKMIVLNSLIHLVNEKKIRVYGFVIMPNHIHIIWEMTDMNKKEMPHASFMKFTGHRFLEELRKTNDPLLDRFKVESDSRNHLFWQRDALPILIFSREMLQQKLFYIHNNPLQEHWQLVSDPNDYFFSSCSFYEQGDKRFDWLTHYMDAM